MEQQQQQQQQPKDTRTAGQKITDLEEGLLGLYQTADNMARDLMTTKEAIKLLGNKVDSIVKASASGQEINDVVISKIMIDNNVEELKQKVTNLVAQGMLEAQDTASDNSFVVGREENADGETVNPRLQFALSALPQQEFRNKIKAAKIGDVIDLQEGKLKFVLLESYAIVTPKPAMQAVPAEEQQPVVAPGDNLAVNGEQKTVTSVE